MVSRINSFNKVPFRTGVISFCTVYKDKSENDKAGHGYILFHPIRGAQPVLVGNDNTNLPTAMWYQVKIDEETHLVVIPRNKQ